MNALKTGVMIVLVTWLAACNQRQIVEFGAVVDAPHGDASAIDAAHSDGPSRDALVDAPRLDAFVPDAFVPDASVPDAFVPDASVRDAFVADAPVRDAPARDAAADAAPDAGGLVPTVVSTVPANGALGVPVNTPISATFSEAMDPTTLTALTFTVAHGATAVIGAVTYDGPSRTASFTPVGALLSGVLYTATITTGAKSTSGVALAAPHVWTFTTVGTAPTVIATNPLDHATNVGATIKPTATFSTAMDPTTITALTFKLATGATPVVGMVTYDAVTHIATFTPTMPLTLGAVYTATITTGAKDTSGVALAASFTWTFTIGACGQAPVALGAVDGFVVFGGSTVTSSGPTSLTGDLGVSPGTAITGFPPGIVVGATHAGDAVAALAAGALTTAFNDAAGRTLCAVTVAGNLGGQTLTPGLYKSTSSLAISSGNLTLDAQGDPNAVFIFQMASTLTTSPGLLVILTNGANPANIYWEVGTSATLGTTSVFAGTILASQSISINTGATLTGRALAMVAAVTLQSNTIVKPAP